MLAGGIDKIRVLVGVRQIMWAMRTNRKRNICRGANHVLGAGRRTNHVRDAEDQSHEGCRSVDQSHLTTSGALAGEGPDQGGGGAQGRA